MKTKFNVTIATYPNQISLQNDIRYIKSTLLYADNVTLISPLASVYTDLSNNQSTLDEIAVLNLFERAAPYCRAGDVDLEKQIINTVEKLRVVMKTKNRSIPMTKRLEFNREFLKYGKEIITVIEEFFGVNSCKELSLLLKVGAIKIEDYQSNLNEDRFVYEFYEKLKTAINSSYPLFDKKSNDIIQAAINDGILNVSDINKYKLKSTSATDEIIMQLPSFEMASCDEILDIKKDLNKYLINFRSAMLKYSDSIKNLPWDEDFVQECRILYDKELLPSLCDMEEKTKSNSFIKNLSIDLITDKSLLKTAGAICLCIASKGAINSFMNVASVDKCILATTSLYGVKKIAEQYKEYIKNRKEIESNELYFYYKASKKIEQK